MFQRGRYTTNQIDRYIYIYVLYTYAYGCFNTDMVIHDLGDLGYPHFRKAPKFMWIDGDEPGGGGEGNIQKAIENAHL